MRITRQKDIVKLSIMAVAEATATGLVQKQNASRLAQVEERSRKTTEVKYFSKGNFQKSFHNHQHHHKIIMESVVRK